ncbi:MAG: phosphoglycerate dehydrogenase [Gemmatimonadaceae bacterium]|nr:phosphoglycerate dehydrogenase [Gemmatimonadaceae bacterium]
MRYRVLVTDEVDPDGLALLLAEPRLQVDEVPTLPAADLLTRIPDYDAIVGRSATRISRDLLRAGARLRVVGRAGVGVDNVDMATATELGIAVINAPAGNTVAVAELLFGSLLALFRHIVRADTSMHAGRWDRSALLGSELKGRTLGIVGVGRIGSEVATRALAFGMDVIGYDPYVGDERFRALRIQRAPSLEVLLAEADILTIHTPLTAETTGMFGRRELARLPGGAVLCNLARGGIVDDTALAQALQSGLLRGACIDAFAQEPLPAEHLLRTLPNVLLTPHLGASTAEAQRNVAVDVCEAVRDALLHGELTRSLNVATVSGTEWKELQPALLMSQRAAAIARALLLDQGISIIQRVRLRVSPDLVGAGAALLSAACAGILEGVIDDGRLNLINARAMAEARGIELSIGELTGADQAATIDLSLGGGVREIGVAAMAPKGGTARVMRIGAFHVDVTPRQTMIVLTNNDVPGVIGRVGTVLGDAHVNIAEYHQARLAQGGEALAAISVDGVVAPALRATLLALPDVRTATIVRFGGGDSTPAA